MLGRIVRHHTMVPWSRTDGNNSVLAPRRGEIQILTHVAVLNSWFLWWWWCQQTSAAVGTAEPVSRFTSLQLVMITATLSLLVNFLYYHFLIIILAYPCTYKTFTVNEKAPLCWQQLHASRFLMHWCWVTHPYHLVLLSNVWCFHNKIMKSARQWKALGNVLNEITQPQKCICCVFSFLGTSWLLSVNMCDLGVSPCG